MCHGNKCYRNIYPSIYLPRFLLVFSPCTIKKQIYLLMIKYIKELRKLKKHIKLNFSNGIHISEMHFQCKILYCLNIFKSTKMYQQDIWHTVWPSSSVKLPLGGLQALCYIKHTRALFSGPAITNHWPGITATLHFRL